MIASKGKPKFRKSGEIENQKSAYTDEHRVMVLADDKLQYLDDRSYTREQAVAEWLRCTSRRGSPTAIIVQCGEPAEPQIAHDSLDRDGRIEEIVATHRPLLIVRPTLAEIDAAKAKQRVYAGKATRRF